MAGEQGGAGEEGEEGASQGHCPPPTTPLPIGSSSLQPAVPQSPPSVGTAGSDTR